MGDHLEALRRVIGRVLIVVAGFSVVVFCMKDWTFRMLLAPKDTGFVTFRAIERLSDYWAGIVGGEPFRFAPYHIDLISTELSAQFMLHLSSSMALGALLASPYIIYQVFGYVRPALYEHERRYGTMICLACYVLFVLGVLMSYFVLFPISFRFLGTYQVADSVSNVITLDSYISTFTTLTFMMGLVFQLPVLAWILAKMDLVSSAFLAQYRRHSFVMIMIVSAIITPPDAFTLILVTVPLYFLYELCILIVRRMGK